MKSFELRGTKENTYHLSVGAVIWHEKNIALIKKHDGYYSLPRETVYLNESLEESISRGLKEEIGISKIEIKRFLGSQITFFDRDSSRIEKTTLYFEVKMHNKNDIRTPEIDEEKDEILWVSLKKAISLLQKIQNEEYKIVQKVI